MVVLGVDEAVVVLTPDVASVPVQEQVVVAPMLTDDGVHDAEAVGFVVSIISVLFAASQSLLPAESLQ